MIVEHSCYSDPGPQHTEFLAAYIRDAESLRASAVCLAYELVWRRAE